MYRYLRVVKFVKIKIWGTFENLFVCVIFIIILFLLCLILVNVYVLLTIQGL